MSGNGIMGGIMSIFGGNTQQPPAPQPTNAVSQQGQQQSAPQPDTNGAFAGVTPQDPTANALAGQPGQAASTPAGSQSPLDQFQKLWETAPNTNPNGPVFNVTPQQIQAEAAKMNFAATVAPEIIQKALTGDANAFAQAINIASQNAFAHATHATTIMVDKALEKRLGEFSAKLPDQIRDYQAQTGLANENPMFSNPAVKPLVTMVQKQMATQFPTATPEQINAHVKEYLTGVFGAITPQQAAAQGDPNNLPFGTKSGTDWEKLLSM